MSFAILDAPKPVPKPRRALRAPLLKHEVTREISYAASASSRPGRAFIRTMENATGRLNLIRRAAHYEDDLAMGRDFWRVMIERFGIQLEVLRGSLETIPAEGPLVLVSNHPYGILDGLVMGHILSGVRGGDFRILAHQVFRRAAELDRVILPIDFAGTRAAQEANIRARADAISYLKKGGAVGVFPGGTVSTSRKPFQPPMDPVWRGFSARMVQKSGATVVPIWFEGQNSSLFQLSSHISYTLRMALLVREFKARVDQPVRLVVGSPIAPEQILQNRGAKETMDFLRRKTYDLSPTSLDASRLGYEFEERYRR